MENTEVQRVPQQFSLVAIRIDKQCSKSLRKILSQEWYFFNNWYELRNGAVTRNDMAQFSRGLYGENISVQAIVGKNGSGKSSIMELVYRIVNNFSFCMMQGSHTAGAWPLKYIEEIYADLYFESEGQLGHLSIQGLHVQYVHGQTNIEFDADQMQGSMRDRASLEKLEFISRTFCFTLVYNYALMAMNPWDYQKEHSLDIDVSQKESWLDRLYNKNDGYTAAIGFEPYRGNGIIDLNRQKNLCTTRLLGVLIDSKNRGTSFFDGYSCEDIFLKFDSDYLSKKVNPTTIDIKHGGRHPLIEFPSLFRNGKTFTATILRHYNIDKLNLSDSVVCSAAMYVVIKTLQIAELYPKFDKYQEVGKVRYYARETEAFDKHYYHRYSGKEYYTQFSSELSLSNLVYAIQEDESHITLKLRQTLNFLELVKQYYELEDDDWTCPEIKRIEDYQGLFNMREYDYGKKINKSLQDIINYCPPPFFTKEIFLSREKGNRKGAKDKGKHIPYENLSSGEKQFLQTAISVIYHIRNIVSVQDLDGLAKYYNVNLFLDEVEVCFHPEYQQKFLSLLLGMITEMKLNEGCNINIIVATHSPFILSDIPKSNILYLEDGIVPDASKGFVNPFCANVNELLRQSFFLSSGLMGTYAKEMIEDLLMYLKPNEQRGYLCKRAWDEEKSKSFINMIGEPLLKNSLMNLYREKFHKSKDEMIQWHKQEMERLMKENQHNETIDNNE